MDTSSTVDYALNFLMLPIMVIAPVFISVFLLKNREKTRTEEFT